MNTVKQKLKCHLNRFEPSRQTDMFTYSKKGYISAVSCYCWHSLALRLGWQLNYLADYICYQDGNQ